MKLVLIYLLAMQIQKSVEWITGIHKWFDCKPCMAQKVAEVCGHDGRTYQNSCFSACSMSYTDEHEQTTLYRHRGRCVGTKGTKGAKEVVQCAKVAGLRHGANYKWVVILIF